MLWGIPEAPCLPRAPSSHTHSRGPNSHLAELSRSEESHPRARSISVRMPRGNRTGVGGAERKGCGESNHTEVSPHTQTACAAQRPHIPSGPCIWPLPLPCHPTLCQPFRGHFLFLSRWPSCLSGMIPSAPRRPRGSSTTSHSSLACSSGPESEWLGPGRCMQPRAGLGWFPAEQPRARAVWAGRLHAP